MAKTTKILGVADDAITIAASCRRPELFSTIFDRHFSAVHRYLSRRVGRDEADDLASMAFVVAFERRRTFHSTSTTALPWLLGIATNLLRERYRSDARQRAALAAMAGEAATASAGEESDSPLLIALTTAICDLDPDQRDVLLLHAWADLSYEQIAEAIDVPIGTVRSRLSRARAHLRAQLATPEPYDLEPRRELL